MQRFLWFILKISVVMSGLLALLIGWQALTRANTGAPILLVVNNSASNKFGPYLGEILRAEGLNSFDVVQLSSLTANDLSNHDLTILAETSLTLAQKDLLTNYVNGGGRLLAMRPSVLIKDLFGLGTPAGITLIDGYVKINTSASLNGSVPGQGLTSATLQIHGTADQYTSAGGAVVLAQLYSNATTSTLYPAVIAGSSGRAVAFVYDLAQNVAYTRQGNPANADLDVDGDGVVRTIDLFTSPLWIDRDKIPIPQADEQQRLFARLVKQLVGEVRPLPQLWYFPGTAKTMLMLTGDAHGQGRDKFINEINSLSAHGGTATFYISQTATPTSTDMNTWRGQGYEFGIHPNWTSGLNNGYNEIINNFWDLIHSDVPRSRTVRHHQVVWEGWTDAAEIAAAHGMAMETNFYHWGTWLKKPDGTWPHGYITGSGQPMKFITADGDILPIYQQATQLVDEHLFKLYDLPGIESENLNSSQALAVSKELIDASQAGSYTALMAQLHLDYYDFGHPQPWAEQTLDYANSLGVPVWNADQWLSFTETRHNANYGGINWNNTTKTLTFNLSATATSGISLTTILPLSYNGNSLQSIRVDGGPVSYSIQSIKGVNVAFVSASAGNHTFVAQYHNNSPNPIHKVFLPVILK